MLGQYLCGFLMAPVDGDFFFNGTAGNCLQGTFPALSWGGNFLLTAPADFFVAAASAEKGLFFQWLSPFLGTSFPDFADDGAHPLPLPLGTVVAGGAAPPSP